MSRRGFLAWATLVASLSACADLGRRSVVTIGRESLDLDELRRIYADLPPGERPSLATRPERLAFVERLVRRRLLAEHGASLPPDSTLLESARHDREDVILRRLEAIEGGMGDFERSEVDSTTARMKDTFRIRRFLFPDSVSAARGAALLAGGAPPGSLAADPSCRVVGPELHSWVPWPLDPVLEEISRLGVGDISAPIETDGRVQIVQVLDRATIPAGSPEFPISRIEEAIRRRHRALTVEALDRRLRESASPRVDEEALQFVVAKTRAAILEGGLAEVDPNFAIPVVSDEEMARPLASYRIAGGADTLTVGDYVQALRQQIVGRRPTRGPLQGMVRRSIEQELARRLRVAEAERRGLFTDWWAERELARLEEERLVRRAVDEIEKGARPSESAVDSLAALLAEAGHSLVTQPSTARVLRADLPSEASAIEEKAKAIAAGGMRARYGRVLDGLESSEATYHFFRLVPGSTGSSEIEAAIFGRPPGIVQGPFAFGLSWLILESLDVEPQRDRGPEEIRREARENLRGGRRGEAVDSWVQARRMEVGVTIDEELLDGLAPGA